MITVRVTSKSKDFPTYVFNNFVGKDFIVTEQSSTPTEGKISKRRQPCYWVQTGLDVVKDFAIPNENCKIIKLEKKPKHWCKEILAF